jgi:uncharacterized protein YjlB
MTQVAANPEQFLFKDDGKIPNSKYPVLLYRNIHPSTEKVEASWFKRQFAKNNWTNAWENGIYSYHHYHSTTHEVLGVYQGSALLHVGGENGARVEVQAGDVIVIPAGVGHKNLRSSQDFGVVGAYPDGRDWDLLKGEKGERPTADNNIASLPLPDFDPILGKDDGLKKIWDKL